MTSICPVCGYKKYDGYGHRWKGKKTPPKTRWCTGRRPQGKDKA